MKEKRRIYFGQDGKIHVDEYFALIPSESMPASDIKKIMQALIYAYELGKKEHKS